MNANVQIVLSFALTFGVPILFALRELMVLRRHRGDGGGRDEPPAEPKSPKPLPDCLIPKPMARRPERVLETV